MARNHKTEKELSDLIDGRSQYESAAARWVANYNRSTYEWATQQPDHKLFNERYITDVTFETVGAYAYSEMTYDHGDAGISYTFWEPYVVTKGQHKGEIKYRPVQGMEIRWYRGMNAGTFIEECVALLRT